MQDRHPSYSHYEPLPTFDVAQLPELPPKPTTYVVRFRVPAEHLDVACRELMAVAGVDCVEAVPLSPLADPDPGPQTSTWY